MAEIQTLDLNSIGLIRDIQPHLLPMEAFSLANNVRISGASIERIGGRTASLITPSVAPYFASMVRGPLGEIYWVYFGLNKAYIVYAGVETEITRLAGNYNATDALDFNSTLLGGIPIFNTGYDVPQYWSPVSPAFDLQNLPVWAAADRAKVFRSFGPFLIAYNVTIGATSYPNLVWWAHPADPGGTPISWDETDPTRDAGKNDLPDTESGGIVDARLLRGNMYIYKDKSTWIQRYIGGPFIFSFDTFLETSGILGPRCVTSTGDAKWHFVVTQDDIIIHDGNNVIPLLPNRMKKTIFNAIDTNTYRTSFTFVNPKLTEIWFCYPENGQAQPNRALIWNYGNGSSLGAFTEADVDFRSAAIGDLEPTSTDTWDSESIMTWDGGPADFWDSVDRATLLLSKPSATKFVSLDTLGAIDNDGVPITGTIQREGLAVIGRRKDNSQINDFDSRKSLRRVWIRATGGPMTVRIGMQEVVNGNVTWTDSVAFDPATQLYADFFVSGVCLAIEFSGAVPFVLSGYKMEIMVGGRF